MYNQDRIVENFIFRHVDLAITGRTSKNRNLEGKIFSIMSVWCNAVKT